MNLETFFEKNKYYSLIIELQKARHSNYINNIKVGDFDIIFWMDDAVDHNKIVSVSDYISKKYKIYTEINTTNKSIIVYDAHTLNYDE